MRDDDRHFGLVVDDRSRVRELAEAAGAKILKGGFLDFLDPWGNRIQVVEYRDFTCNSQDACCAEIHGAGPGEERSGASGAAQERNRAVRRHRAARGGGGQELREAMMRLRP